MSEFDVIFMKIKEQENQLASLRAEISQLLSEMRAEISKHEKFWEDEISKLQAPTVATFYVEPEPVKPVEVKPVEVKKTRKK